MPLETLQKDAPVNVKTLTLESPAPKDPNNPFDPEKEITANDWSRILSEVRDRDYRLMRGGFRYLPSVAILDRAKIPDIETLLMEYKSLYENGDLSFDQYYAYLAILNPDELPEIETEFPDEIWINVEKSIAQPGIMLKQQFIRAYNTKLALPNFDLSLIKDSAEGLIRFRNCGEDPLVVAATSRVLFPQLSVKLDAGFWDSARRQLDHNRTQDNMLNFVETASQMKIAAADLVEVRPTGLFIRMKPENAVTIHSQSPVIPERRRF